MVILLGRIWRWFWAAKPSYPAAIGGPKPSLKGGERSLFFQASKTHCEYLIPPLLLCVFHTNFMLVWWSWGLIKLQHVDHYHLDVVGLFVRNANLLGHLNWGKFVSYDDQAQNFWNVGGPLCRNYCTMFELLLWLWLGTFLFGSIWTILHEIWACWAI